MAFTRRDFIKASSAAGLALGFRLDAAPAPAGGAALRPNAWIQVGRDGRVAITVGKSEMGQGVRTALPMIAADELGADLSQVDLAQAEPGPDFPHLGTGGSRSLQTSWAPLRLAAAAVREMLTQAAASGWGVDPAACRTEMGEVVHPPSGRRAPFGKLVPAAARLPVPKDPKPSQAHTLLGKPAKRLDGPRIVEGKALYGLDIQLPGMKRAALARCPVFGGRARRWDEAAILKRPGVRKVVPLGSGIAVVADTTWQALEAAAALKVVWDEGPNDGFTTDTYRSILDATLAKPGAVARAEGHPSRALADAARRLEAVYEFPWQAHAPLEPPNAVARITPGACEIWAGTQNPNDLQVRAAALLGLHPEAVRVHVTLLGGGFGRRLNNDFALEAVALAKALDAPVQVVWSRRDDLTHDHYHPMSLHRLEAAVDEGGLLAWTHRVAAPSILLSWSEGRRSEAILHAEIRGADDLPYRCPHLRVDYSEAPCHVPLGWWRAIEDVPNIFARECFVDETAAAAGKDPLAWRLQLLGADRILEVGDVKVETGRLRRVLELAADKAGWGRPLPAGRGRGLACAAFDGRTYVALVAEVAVTGKAWKVARVVAAVDCGLVVNPLGAAAQVESGITWGLSALRTQVTFKDGRVEQGSLQDLPVLMLPEAPVVEAHFVPSQADPNGLGEPPVPLVAPAVLNAVFQATGQRIRRLPLRLS